MSHPLAQDLEHVLGHTRGLWDDLRGARLFITGGTGFFGTWLLESFAWANDRLRLGATAFVLSRDPQRFRVRAPHLAADPAIRFVAGDLTSFDAPADPKGPFSHVIHAAADARPALTDQDPLRMVDSIVAGTRRVLEFARENGARRVLLTSSGAIYGRQPPEVCRVTEDFGGAPDPADVRSAYAQGKRMAEWLCCAYAAKLGVPCTIARCFAFVGPHLPLDAHFAAGNFVRDAAAGREIVVSGDGTPFRSYLYTADLAVWLWTVLLRGVPGRPYNVGSDQAVSIRDLAATVAGLVPGASFRVMKEARPGVRAERYVPSVERAGGELGLARHIDLEEGLRRTLRFVRGAC